MRERASELGVVFDENKGNGGGVFFSEGILGGSFDFSYTHESGAIVPRLPGGTALLSIGCASTKVKDNKM